MNGEGILARRVCLWLLLAALLSVLALGAPSWAQDSTETPTEQAAEQASEEATPQPSDGQAALVETSAGTAMQILEIGGSVEGALTPDVPSIVYALSGQAGDII